MTIAATPSASSAAPRRLSRSITALVVGFFSVAILSLGTDEILHLLGVYPPWNMPMWSPGLNSLALAYRIIFTVFGGYLTARLAPHAPMRHVLIVGIVGTVLSIGGVIASMTMKLGPMWYPVALAVASFPSLWVGGMLHSFVDR